MNIRNSPTPIDLHSGLKVVRFRFQNQVKKHWLKVAVLSALAFAVYRKDLSIDLYLNAIPTEMAGSDNEPISETVAAVSTENPRPMNVSLIPPKPSTPSKKTSAPAKGNLANTYSNMTYTRDAFATNETEAEREAKRQKQLAYVKRFAIVAQTEMKKFGIPASIVLAQGLLESDAGESQLALKNNNHFGIKCFSRTCKKGHCSNFTDDSHKDFFRIYKSPWESYRAHSYLLQADRYSQLYNLNRTDYKDWALGLKKAGYATDKYYGEKLINLIEDLNLHQYDF